MSKKDFLSEIQRLKQARINLVAAKMEQILLQELALACVNKIQLKGTLNKEFSTNIKQWLPAKITDKVEGIPLREWEQSARVRTTVGGGGGRRRKYDDDDEDYYDHSPSPAGLLTALLGTGGTVTSGYFLYNFLSKEENREKLKEALGFARQGLEKAIGLEESQAANKKLIQLLNEANKQLAEFASVYTDLNKSDASLPEKKDSTQAKDIGEQDEIGEISEQDDISTISEKQVRYVTQLNSKLTEFKKLTTEAKEKADGADITGINIEDFGSKYSYNHLSTALLYLPPDGNKKSQPTPLQQNGKKVTFAEVFSKLQQSQEETIRNEFALKWQQSIQQEMQNRMQQYQTVLKNTPSYVMLLGVLKAVTQHHRNFFKSMAVRERWGSFRTKADNWINTHTMETQNNNTEFNNLYTMQMAETENILETLYKAAENFDVYEELKKPTQDVTVMLVTFILDVWNEQLVNTTQQQNLGNAAVLQNQGNAMQHY